MSTMIADAVRMLKETIDSPKAAQARRYGRGQLVAVRYRTTVGSRSVVTWRTGRVTEFVQLNSGAWLYWLVRLEGRRLVYMPAVESDIRKL